MRGHQSQAVESKQDPRMADHHGGDGARGHAEMKHDETMDHGQMMAKRHQQTLWVHYIVITIGAWLILSPFTVDGDEALQWSDIASGSLLIVFGALSVSRRYSWIRWGTCLVGIWLLFAPLVFWAPTAQEYTTDTIAGALAIAFSILVPGMPGMLMLPGPERPPGWSYNPSTWLQRGPIIALGFVGFFLARYMTAYQLDHVDNVWDPLFKNGGARVLDSDVSRAWPISDAGFGALTYMLESLSGFMGGQQRWRSMPWMVALFGILVLPLGITSVVLIILQPLMVGTFFTLALVAALAMLAMVALALDEVMAMGQFLIQARREGQPLWRTFWRGGTLEQAGDEQPYREGGRPLAAMAWGTTPGWQISLVAALGVWLMFAPLALDSSGSARDSDHLVGALIVTIAFVAMSEVGRAARFAILPLAGWAVLAPWLLEGSTTASAVNAVVVGVACGALSLPRGKVRDRYGLTQRLVL